MDRQDRGQREALDGRRGESACRRRGLSHPFQGRQRGRCRDRDPARARLDGAAVLRARRRRLHVGARRAHQPPARLRWPRDGTRGRAPRSLSQEWPSARFLRRGARRQVGRRTGHRAAARDRTPQARTPAVAATLRARDRARRGRLRDLAAPAPAARLRAIHHAAAPALVFLRRQRQGAGGGNGASQSRVRKDAACNRRGRCGRVLQGTDRRRHRGDGDEPSVQSRGSHARGSRGLPGDRARSGVRHVPCLSRVRLPAAVVGRDHHPADAEDARAVRCRVDGRGLVLERALRERSGAARIRRPQRLRGGPGVLFTACRPARRCIPAGAIAR